MTTCVRCEENEVTINTIAYYLNGKAVYKNLCGDCTKKEFENSLEYLNHDPKN